jgi:hypothetical protein
VKDHSLNRRSFLRTAAAGATAAIALPDWVPSRVLGAVGQPGANEVVNVGLIGLGGRARALTKTCLDVPQMRIVAVCDVFKPRCDDFLGKFAGHGWKPYFGDFRRMIEKEKLDAAIIATTTHARAWITILAMQAGLDVYFEKPMCLTIAEGRTMVKAARALKRVTQVGTQQRSMPINNWASDLVKNGALGKIHTVLAPNFVGPDKWVDQPGEPMPDGGSDHWWDLWTNQAVLRPYHSRLHYGWKQWSDFTAGGRCFGVDGWGSHSYDQVNRALGTDETGPVELLLEEPLRVMPSGKFVHDAELTGIVGDEDSGQPYHGMSKLVGPRARVTMTFATGTKLKLHLDGDRGPGLGAIFLGEKGKLEINRNKIVSNPKEIIQSPDNPGPNRRDETIYHVENWIDCIKSRKRCNADVEYGQRSNTLCDLVNIVRDVGRVGEVLKWDPVAERFTNCEEANAMLSRPRRQGYELPEIG